MSASVAGQLPSSAHHASRCIFRGEALSSLCELSGSFTVCTATEEAEAGTRLTYSHSGALVEEAPAARTQGTTVTATELFSPLPVRRREFLKACKKQYAKALQVVSAYAVICCGVRFAVKHATKAGGKWNNVITTAGNGRMRDAVSSVFGPKFFKGLEPVSIDLATPPALPPPPNTGGGGATSAPDEDGESTADGLSSVDVSAFLGPGESPAVSSATPSKSQQTTHDGSDDTDVAGGSQGAANTSMSSPPPPDSPVIAPTLSGRIHGFVSKSGAGIGRSNNERQFLFVNGRPVDMGRLTRAVNEVWRVYEMKHKPAFVLNLQLPPRTYDVNVAPDKRDVILTEQGALLDALKAGLHAIWAPSRGRFTVSAANGSAAAKAGQGSIPTIQELLAKRAAKRTEATAAAAPGPTAPTDDDHDSDQDEGSHGADAWEEGSEVEAVKQATAASPVASPVVPQAASTNSPPPRSNIDPPATAADSSSPAASGAGDSDRSPSPQAPAAAAGGWTITILGGEEGGEEGGLPAATPTHQHPASGIPPAVCATTESPPAAPVAPRVIASTAGRSRRGMAAPPSQAVQHIPSQEDTDGDVVCSPAGGSAAVISSTAVAARTPPRAAMTPPRARARVTILDDDSSQETVVQAPLQSTDKAASSPQPPLLSSTAAAAVVAVQSTHGSPVASPSVGAAPIAGNMPRMPRIPPRQKRTRSGAPISPGSPLDGGGTGGASPHTPAMTGADPLQSADMSGVAAAPVDSPAFTDVSGVGNADVGGLEDPPQASTPAGGAASGEPPVPPSSNKRRRRAEQTPQVEHFDWPSLTSASAMKGGAGGQHMPWNGDAQLLMAQSQGGDAQAMAASVAPVLNVFDADTDEEGDEGDEWGSQQPAAVGAEADAALSRVLTKDKFRSMHVVGQFNLGFIVAASGSDLFILDQHACDEKVRYEKYCAGLELQQQPLIIPAPLDMTAGEELVVLEHMDVFQANGFKFAVDEDAVPGRRVRLAAIPFSKQRQFGVEDVKELASMLAADPYMARRGDVRLPKIKYMLASRACRTAIMIGDPLKRDAMRRVVHGMAVLDQPWNCPHGRPTMRHLVDMAHVDGLPPVQQAKIE